MARHGSEAEKRSRAGLSGANKLPMAAMTLEHLCKEGISSQPSFSTRHRSEGLAWRWSPTSHLPLEA